MKRTQWLIDVYHFGDDDARASVDDLVKMVKELRPDASVNLEPVKTDFSQLTVEVEE
jgi:hypothetical protein